MKQELNNEFIAITVNRSIKSQNKCFFDVAEDMTFYKTFDNILTSVYKHTLCIRRLIN